MLPGLGFAASRRGVCRATPKLMCFGLWFLSVLFHVLPTQKRKKDVSVSFSEIKHLGFAMTGCSGPSGKGGTIPLPTTNHYHKPAQHGRSACFVCVQSVDPKVSMAEC